MGSCLSKKNEQATALNASVPVMKQPEEGEGPRAKKKRAEEGEGPRAKKEIFVIKHRRSHERERDVSPLGSNNATSSCTKEEEEEVDAILIQCGRLSRNNSSENVGASWSRKYSGSKRSYDFDQSLEAGGSAGEYGDDGRETRRDRSRDRQSSGKIRSGSSSHGRRRRRRTPSTERDQRSGSRERRVSRSPGRRLESNSNANNVGNSTTNSTNNRPGKLVSVPATVSSLAMDKGNNGTETTSIMRISVKRNVGENAPRSISPARVNARAACEGNNQQQQQPSLSRNSSKKAEHSPYRRNPLAEIDPNSLVNNKGLQQKPTAATNNLVITKEGNHIGSLDNKAKYAKEQLHTEEAAPANASIAPGDDESSSRPQMLTRSRAARLSRELDINPEALLDQPPSYTALLLEDIQNFHQKNVPIQAVSLPPCLSKARSILEAVADLNSTTSSNLVGKNLSKTKGPFVESEIQASDDLVEPSIHKYVTSGRGGSGKNVQPVPIDASAASR